MSGHFTVVVNTTFRLCPWADVLFAFDAKWWREYHAEVRRTFKGKLLTFAHSAEELEGVQSLDRCQWFGNFGNSGACAIGLAISAGAEKIILLGYDCQVNGKTHWHGDHPKGFNNVTSIQRWPAQFRSVAMDAEQAGIEIINVSRETILKCFKNVPLEEIFK